MTSPLFTITELDATSCRYPIADAGQPSDRAQFFFCAAPTRHGKPYCTCHSEVAYDPSGQGVRPHPGFRRR